MVLPKMLDPAYPIANLGQFSVPLGKIDWYDYYRQTMKAIHFALDMGNAQPAEGIGLDDPRYGYDGSLSRGALMTYHT